MMVMMTMMRVRDDDDMTIIIRSEHVVIDYLGLWIW